MRWLIGLCLLLAPLYAHAQQQPPWNWNFAHVFIGPVNMQGPIVSYPQGGQDQITIAPVDGPLNDWLWGRMRWFGTIAASDPLADNQISVNKLLFTDAAIINSTGGSAGSLLVTQIVSGNTDAGNTSARGAMHSRIVATGQIGPTPILGPTITPATFVSSLSTGYATASQGGLGGWSDGLNPSVGYYRGSLFGGNDNIWLTSAATDYYHLIGREIDVSIKDTGSVYDRTGLLIASGASSKQADGDDTAVAIISNDTNNAVNWKTGISFGTSTASLAVSQALIRVTAKKYPSLSTPALVDGIDLTQGSFSGHSIIVPGASIDGSGNAIVNTVKTALFTVATLPACASGLKGAIATVTDATAPSYNSTLTGGGAVTTLALCNGTAWTAH